jgi:hypothetical protein
MHVLAEIAVLLQNGSHTSSSDGWGLLYYTKAVWSFVFSNWSNIVKLTLALATLLSTGGVLGGRFGWLQRFIAPKRRSDLVEQISKLAESMSKLHELPEWTGDLNAEIKAALRAEMEMKLSELKKLQQPVKWEYGNRWSVKSWLKYSFLWWRPRGFGAWCFHLSYYLLLALVGMTSLGLLLDILYSLQGTRADFSLAIRMYTILGVLAMVLRFFAVRIYRHQCDESSRKCEAQPA